MVKDWEDVSKEQAFWEFVDILQLKLLNTDKVTLLLGNHDLHYLWHECMDCTRKYEEKAVFYHHLFKHSLNNFSIALFREYNGKKYLFSHAGILAGWLEDNMKIFQNFLRENPNEDLENSMVIWLNGFLHGDSPKILAQVGPSRWGSDDYGSPIWADVNEHADGKYTLSMYQIFGHTLMEHPIITPKWACLDCRHAFELDSISGEITIIE